jgi:hypothetical protein
MSPLRVAEAAGSASGGKAQSLLKEVLGFQFRFALCVLSFTLSIVASYEA